MSSKKIKPKIGLESLCTWKPNISTTEEPHNVPIYATSSFDMNDLEQSIAIFNGEKPGFVYSRYDNPTVQAAAQKIATLEAGRLNHKTSAIMLSSGMAAITTLLHSILNKDDILLSHNGLYGGTTEIIDQLAEKIGFRVIYTNLNNLNQLKEICDVRPATAIYLESPSNPLLHCVDLAQLADFAKILKIKTIVDNTICTPALQRPLNLGIDYVVYSNTKYLSGHGNTISGCIVSNDTAMMQGPILKSMRLLGTNCSPFEAWLVYNGIKTLALRMSKQCENAARIAAYLNVHPAVKVVHHTSLAKHPDHDLASRQMTDHAPLMSFEVKGGLKAAGKVLNHLKMIKHATTLGDLDTLVLHPDTSSHRNISKKIKNKQGITSGLIRLSSGIENVDDLINDLAQAIGKIKN